MTKLTFILILRGEKIEIAHLISINT